MKNTNSIKLIPAKNSYFIVGGSDFIIYDEDMESNLEK